MINSISDAVAAGVLIPVVALVAAILAEVIETILCGKSEDINKDETRGV